MHIQKSGPVVPYGPKCNLAFSVADIESVCNNKFITVPLSKCKMVCFNVLCIQSILEGQL